MGNAPEDEVLPELEPPPDDEDDEEELLLEEDVEDVPLDETPPLEVEEDVLLDVEEDWVPDVSDDVLPDVSEDVSPDSPDVAPLESTPDDEKSTEDPPALLLPAVLVPDWPLDPPPPDELAWPLLVLVELLVLDDVLLLEDAWPDEDDALLPEPALHVPLSQNAFTGQSSSVLQGEGRHPEKKPAPDVTTTLNHIQATRFIMGISIVMFPLCVFT